MPPALAPISFSFARVFGPTLPYPSSPGPEIPCFSWNLLTALSVAEPKNVLSFPGDPAPISAIRVSASLLSIFCKIFTEAFVTPLLRLRDTVPIGEAEPDVPVPGVTDVDGAVADALAGATVLPAREFKIVRVSGPTLP